VLTQRDLNIWVGESHSKPQGNYLAVNLSAEIEFQNFMRLKPTPRDKRKMPHRIPIFKRIIPHISIQI
jgi:hypothetical protein